jgi:hypothetical protein
MLRGCGIIKCAPIAQLDRASDYESVGRGFESSWARQLFLSLTKNFPLPQADAGAILNRFVRVNNNHSLSEKTGDNLCCETVTRLG